MPAPGGPSIAESEGIGETAVGGAVSWPLGRSPDGLGRGMSHGQEKQDGNEPADGPVQFWAKLGVITTGASVAPAGSTQVVCTSTTDRAMIRKTIVPRMAMAAFPKSGCEAGDGAVVAAELADTVGLGIEVVGQPGMRRRIPVRRA